MKEISQKHIEASPVILKRIRVVGKTLCRARHNGVYFTKVVNGEIVNDPFTIVHVEDVATGEKFDLSISHRMDCVSHLIVDETLYPGNDNVEVDYSGTPEGLKEYDAALQWIPEGAEYKDKNGIWHPYRKCNRYKLVSAIEALTEEERKRIATNKLFEFMQGRSYDVTNATPEDRDLYNELLDTVTKWEDEEKEK